MPKAIQVVQRQLKQVSDCSSGISVCCKDPSCRQSVTCAASLSAAVANVNQATVQQSNVSTTQPQTRALASSTVDARAEFQVAGAWGTAVAAFSANDSSQHGLATTQVNELAPPSFCKAIAQHVYLNTFSAYAAKCHLP